MVFCHANQPLAFAIQTKIGKPVVTFGGEWARDRIEHTQVLGVETLIVLKAEVKHIVSYQVGSATVSACTLLRALRGPSGRP